MFNLVKKDILIQKKMVLLSFAYIPFLLIAMKGAGLIMFPTALIAVTYMLVVTSCAYDDKYNADVMLNSLPLKRFTIVLAKYVSVFVYAALATAVYWLTIRLISVIGLAVEVHPVSLGGLAGGLISVVLISGVYFPVYFKLGYIKSRFLNMILFFTFFFGLTSTVNYLYANKDVAWVGWIKGFLLTQTRLQLVTLTSVLIVAVITISFSLSLKAYYNREF